jgi:hypothetical protein
MSLQLEHVTNFCTECICGHYRYDHDGDHRCSHFVQLEINRFTSCKCNQYRQDNLKYLESLCNQETVNL